LRRWAFGSPRYCHEKGLYATEGYADFRERRTVQPHRFEYVRARTIPEAVRLLRKHGDGAKILAGGQSLIPLMKLRLADPKLLIDIGRIPQLDSLKETSGSLVIGAMTRDREFETSELVGRRYPVLVDVVRGLGDPQVRNLGTIGGSLAHADPAGDWGTVLLALDAQLTLTGPRGSRSIPIDGFFTDTFATALQPDEILTEIRIPAPSPGSGSAYKKLKRKTGDFAIVSVSARVTLGAAGTIAEARLGLGAVGATALRAKAAEASLVGQVPDERAFGEAGRIAAQECNPTSDLHVSADYKRTMVALLAKRALAAAADRARG
jgi:carbon-monoxide dehydrogenase medium subunit